MAKRLKVLIITSYIICPPISGGVKRMLAPIINMTEEDGIDYSLLFMSNTPEEVLKNEKYLNDLPRVEKAKGIAISFNSQYDTTNCPDTISHSVWFAMSKDFRDLIISWVRNEHYDIIQIEHSQMAWIVPYLRIYADSQIVMDCQNLEWLVYKRWLNYAQPQDYEYVKKNYELLKKWEDRVIPWFDAVFCISPVEKSILEAEGHDTRFMYVPTGAGIVDEDYYPPEDSREKKYDMIFIGSMNWFPNAHCLVWFVEEVMPIINKKRPGTKLEIIGSGDPDERMINLIKKYKETTFWGRVEDERTFLHKGKVFVSPIWIGAGVRLKNPTAWAAKIPVVATTLSVEGLEYTPDKDVLIGDTPEAFAEHVLRLLDDPDAREQLAEDAYNSYKGNYSAKKLTRIWRESYFELVGGE